MMKLYGKIKLPFIIAAGLFLVLYLVRAVPSFEKISVRAPKPVEPSNFVKLPGNSATEPFEKKYLTGLYEEIFSTDSTHTVGGVRNLPGAFTTGNFRSGHLEPDPVILSPQLYEKGSYSDLHLASFTGPAIKHEKGAVKSHQCEDIGSEAGKLVSLQRYRTCMEIIQPHSLQKIKSLNNEKLLEMASRRHVYQEACRWPTVEVTGAADFQDVIFDPKHNLSYCKTAKAGSSSILSFIFNIDDVHFDPNNKIGLHEAARMEFPALPGRDGARKMTKDAYSFTSVRHPFRRLVSAYCNKVVEGREQILKRHNNVMLSYRLADTLDIVRKQLPQHRFETSDPSRTRSNMFKLTRKFILDTPGKSEFMSVSGEKENLIPGVPSFREFILFVALSVLRCAGDHICLSELDTHFRPQIVRCNPCAWHFDFILKVLIDNLADHLFSVILNDGQTETLQEDLVWLARVVGATSDDSSSQKRTLRSQLSGDIPRLNASGDRCATYDHYMHGLTSEEIDLIYSAYYNDFRYFGYKPFD